MTTSHLKIPEQIATCGYDVINKEGQGTYGAVYKVKNIDGGNLCS